MIPPLLVFASFFGLLVAAAMGMWGAFFACLLAGFVSAWWWERDATRR